MSNDAMMRMMSETERLLRCLDDDCPAEIGQTTIPPYPPGVIEQANRAYFAACNCRNCGAPNGVPGTGCDYCGTGQGTRMRTPAEARRTGGPAVAPPCDTCGTLAMRYHPTTERLFCLNPACIRHDAAATAALRENNPKAGVQPVLVYV
jgi:hypothetical protein